MICQQIKLSNVEIYLKEKGTISFKKKIQTFEFPEKENTKFPVVLITRVERDVK